MVAKSLPPREDLLRDLVYDSASGTVRWSLSADRPFASAVAGKRWRSRCDGKEAGYLDQSKGYRVIYFGRAKFAAHRLIWMMVHGDAPEQIDHINGDRSDNRLLEDIIECQAQAAGVELLDIDEDEMECTFATLQ